MSVLLREETGSSYPMIFMFKSERRLIAFIPKASGTWYMFNVDTRTSHADYVLIVDCEM